MRDKLHVKVWFCQLPPENYMFLAQNRILKKSINRTLTKKSINRLDTQLRYLHDVRQAKQHLLLVRVLLLGKAHPDAESAKGVAGGEALHQGLGGADVLHLEKDVAGYGDFVTKKGKVTSLGEVLGASDEGRSSVG